MSPLLPSWLSMRAFPTVSEPSAAQVPSESSEWGWPSRTTGRQKAPGAGSGTLGSGKWALLQPNENANKHAGHSHPRERSLGPWSWDLPD